MAKHRKLRPVLTAFCDETGTHSTAPLTCFGGYVFDRDGIDKFNQRWTSLLQPLRSRGIKSFHAAPCNSGDAEFSKLSAAERNVLFGDLIDLVRSTAKVGMLAAIEDAVFSEVMSRNKVQAYTGTKYTACAIRALSIIAEWVNRENYQDQIEYLFESGNDSMGELDGMMRQIAGTPHLASRLRYGGHAFAPKYSSLPLQSADLWVWLWQKSFSEQKQSPYLKNLLREPGRIPHLVSHMSDPSLNILAMVNMFYGVKSEKKYPEQTGKVREYTI